MLQTAMPMAGSWYQVQILVERWFVLDGHRVSGIVEALRGWRADVSLVASTHDHITLEIPTDDLPLRATIFHAAPDAYAEPLQWALAWSPTWKPRWCASRTRASRTWGSMRGMPEPASSPSQ